MPRLLELGEARWAFFTAVGKVCPKTMDELAGDIQAAYWQMPNRDEDGYDEAVTEFQALMKGWQERWNLEDDWIFSLAHETLEDWSKDSEALAERRLKPLYEGVVDPWTIEPNFEPVMEDLFHGRWHAPHQPRSQARRNLRELATACIDDYLYRVEQKLVKQQEPSLPTRTPDGVRGPVENYMILAMYQVGEKSESDLAKALGKTKGAISKLLHSQADSIGLTLRGPLPAGRPRKKGETKTRRVKKASTSAGISKAQDEGDE